MVPAMGLILEAKLLVAHLLQQLPAHAPAPSFQSVPNGSVETLAETMKSTQTNKHQAGELRALPAGRARRRPSPDARGGQGGAGHGADGPGAFTAGSEPRARRRAARRPPRVRAHPPPAGGARCAARRPPRLAATACRPSGPSGAPGLPPDSERPLPDPRVESPHRTAVQGEPRARRSLQSGGSTATTKASGTSAPSPNRDGCGPPLVMIPARSIDAGFGEVG